MFVDRTHPWPRFGYNPPGALLACCVEGISWCKAWYEQNKQRSVGHCQAPESTEQFVVAAGCNARARVFPGCNLVHRKTFISIARPPATCRHAVPHPSGSSEITSEMKGRPKEGHLVQKYEDGADLLPSSSITMSLMPLPSRTICADR